MSGSASSASYDPYDRGIPSRAATSPARPGSRDAIAQDLAARRPPEARDDLPRRDVRGRQDAPAEPSIAGCRSWPGSLVPTLSGTAPSTHLPAGPPGTGADLTRTRVWPSLAHVCKKGSQTLRVGRVDVGQRSETVHRANLSAIVRGLHEHGPQSRSDLVAATGLTRSAIRALVGELAAAGLVTEGGAVRLGTPGRPSPLVRLNSTGAVVLSLEILVDSIAAAIVGLGGETLEHVRRERPRGELLGRRRRDGSRGPGGRPAGPAATGRSSASASPSPASCGASTGSSPSPRTSAGSTSRSAPVSRARCPSRCRSASSTTPTRASSASTGGARPSASTTCSTSRARSAWAAA